MATASLGEVERAVVARLRGDAALKAITGADAANAARVFRGYPTELLARPEQDAFPRITLMRVAADIRRPGRGAVRDRLDLWTWDDVAALDDMEVRVVELLDEVRWSFGTVDIYGFSVGGSERSGRAPRSRLHTFELHVT